MRASLPARSLATLHDREAQARFACDGYVVVDLLPPADLQSLLDIFSTCANAHPGAFISSLLIADTRVRASVHGAVARCLAPLAASLLADYRSIFCGFAVKAPSEAGGDMPLHQDISFSRPEGRPGVSLWAALCDVDARNGGLQVVPGSHRMNAMARAPGSPSAAEPIEAFAAAGGLRQLSLRAGQAVVMNQGVLHASPGNRSNAIRVAATAVAIPAEEPLRYYHRIDASPQPMLEAYAVADTFYTTHHLGCRPANGTRLGTSPERIEPITPGALAALSRTLDEHQREER